MITLKLEIFQILKGRKGREKKKKSKETQRLVTAYLLEPAGAPVSEDSLPS